jgi:hypothetical protein
LKILHLKELFIKFDKYKNLIDILKIISNNNIYKKLKIKFGIGIQKYEKNISNHIIEENNLEKLEIKGLNRISNLHYNILVKFSILTFI